MVYLTIDTFPLSKYKSASQSYSGSHKIVYIVSIFHSNCWKFAGRVCMCPFTPSVPTHQITGCRRSLIFLRASYSSHVRAISSHMSTCETIVLRVLLIRAPPYWENLWDMGAISSHISTCWTLVLDVLLIRDPLYRDHLCGDEMTYIHHHTSSCSLSK